jgi:hypothetical protein
MYQSLGVKEVVDCACSACGILTFRSGMSDSDIAKVCRWIGEKAPNSGIIEGEMVICTEGWDTMLFVTMCEFPEFFVKNNLAMVWRN